MTMLEKIIEEIEEQIKGGSHCDEYIDGYEDGLREAIYIIGKCAEQEPCEDCDYSEIMDWEQNAKTGKAKPIYWCERHKEPKTGRWIETDSHDPCWYICSECHRRMDDKSDYCPSCGASMKGGSE